MSMTTAFVIRRVKLPQQPQFFTTELANNYTITGICQDNREAFLIVREVVGGPRTSVTLRLVLEDSPFESPLLSAWPAVPAMECFGSFFVHPIGLLTVIGPKSNWRPDESKPSRYGGKPI